MKTSPSVAVALTPDVLRLMQVRSLASAALMTLELIRREIYWASKEGRLRSQDMWCGEQDRVASQLEWLRHNITAEEETAKTIGEALQSAGYLPITPSPSHPAGRAMADVDLVRRFATATEFRNDQYASYWNQIKENLKAFLTAETL